MGLRESGLLDHHLVAFLFIHRLQFALPVRLPRFENLLNQHLVACLGPGRIVPLHHRHIYVAQHPRYQLDSEPQSGEAIDCKSMAKAFGMVRGVDRSPRVIGESPSEAEDRILVSSGQPPVSLLEPVINFGRLT